MKKKVIKKLLALLMIITILTADFLVLGTSLITYASQINSETTNQNIGFSVYFKDGENRVDSIEKSIKTAELKLYAEIVVNSEDGYLEKDTIIEVQDSNFNIISTNKGSLEGNKIKLNQINAGQKLEIELGIEPKISDKITTDFLSKTSTVNFTGKYIYSEAEEGTEVQASKSVSVNYQPDDTTQAELETDIITNKVLTLNGANQRIVQLLIKSGLTNNEYPIKQTTINVSIPNLSETEPEVTVMAANGKTQISNMTSENGTVQITLNNEADENNEINWEKNTCDEMVVTYIYPETVDGSKIEITTNSEIKLHNSGNTYTAKYTKGIENQEPSSVIIGKTEIETEEMYKGKIYANIDKEYNTKTSIVVTKTKVVGEVRLQEGTDVFGTAENELIANTKYVTTRINLEKMLSILGQDGNIQIKNGDVTTKINKETAVDENGDVVINHQNSTSQLEITTSIPENEGILEINHTKVITGNTYTREELQTVTTLKAKGLIEGIITVDKEEQKIVENSTETINSTLELKETTSKAELTIDKTVLSATEANEVTVGIKLITDGEQYDLYKNPSIALELPEAVENVEFIEEPSKLYGDEFGTISKKYDATKKMVTISMNGEQTNYPESSLTQALIQLKLKITLKQYALAETDKIVMGYRNENAVKYEEGTTYGIVSKDVEISSPSELIKMFNISVNENTSLTEKIVQRVKEADAGKEYNFNIELLNNKDSVINNVKILGKLPTSGNTITEEDTNTLETILKNVNAGNGTIYYTENAEATEDIENTENGWTQDLTTITNAKLYLIKLDSLARGERYTATVTVQMSNPITENAISYTEYEVIYDTATETGVRENSRKIGLISSMAASIKIETTAQVGQEVLGNGDVVKEGEVVKYTVTVKNNGSEALKDVQLKLDVPEGTVFVKPIEKYTFNEGTEDEFIMEEGAYAYVPNAYYEEITDSENLAKLTELTIAELSPNEPYTINYEVRVNKGTAGTEISNKSTVIYDESSVQAEELKNIIKEANVRVTVKRAIDDAVQLLPNGNSRYIVFVENLSDQTINNLEVQIISKGFNIQSINSENTTSETITISEITPKDDADQDEVENYENGMKAFAIYGSIDKDAQEISICAIVNDSEGEKYRSNLVTEKTPYVNGTISMTSPQNGKVLKEGDSVEYNIVVKNTSDIESVVEIRDIISEHLQVEAIYVNKELKLQKTVETPISNNIDYPIILQPQKQAQIDIIAKVGYIPEIYHGKAITNIATVNIAGVVEHNSELVTHILKASEQQEENVENIISGFAWLDENANGRRDSGEEVLSGVNVKLYNTSTNRYLTDENGNFIEIKTDKNGEYNFNKVQDGAYFIIFEYDTEKYEFTTSFAKDVETSLNSKVTIKQIITDVEQIRVAAIELSDLKENAFNMNIGLKENTGETPKEEQPGIIENTEQPEEDSEERPEENPEKPEENPEENPEEPQEPEQPKDQKSISGLALLDENRNGRKDDNEETLSGIKAKIYNVTTKKYITETSTDANGKYIFNNIEKGLYILIFEYDTEEYEPTIYMAEGIDTTRNSKAVLNNIKINGKEVTVAVTDTINVQDNVSNINIGLKEKLVFDLELNKYISRVVVQNSKETKAYDYNEKSLAKVEIHRKRLQGSMVIVEYTIKVKNTGEISGYAKNIVDYLPSGLTFSSELNNNWYLLNNNLYTKSLENVELKPGEEKEVKLILTKTMTNENAGLINNRAEIYQDYNKYGESDIDSTPNNQVQSEDDMSSVDVIIGPSTGGSNITYTILLIINAILIGLAIRLMIKNEIIKIPTKKERR